MAKRGRPFIKFGEKEKAKIYELVKQGAPMNYIANELKVNRRWIYEKLRHESEFSEEFYRLREKYPPKNSKLWAKMDEKTIKQKVDYIKRRYQKDGTFRLSMSIRALLRYHLKNKNQKTFNCLGFTIDELKKHLEAKFVKGMTWANYGKVWHVDHVIPASWFKYSFPEDEEFKQCWGLHNLQPKFAEENIAKNNKYADNNGQMILLMGSF